MSIYKVLRRAERFGVSFRVCDSKDAGVGSCDQFLAELSLRDCSVYTQRVYAIGLAHFFSWLHASFFRTPKRGSARHGRRQRMTAPELVENAGVPDRFRQIMILYLEAYEARVSDVYRTLRHKVIALAHFWRFIRDKHTDVKRCSQILPRHVRDYILHVIARARAVQRGPGAGEEVRPTAHSWLVDLRVFFSDLCAWANEPDSPFKRFAPRTIPMTRHTLLGYGFEKARERTRARITATVLDLEREMPKIRAFALQQWKTAVAAPKVSTTRGYPWSDEVDTFRDWALLELLAQSGLRIEEASELTTFDILKRKMPDGRIYYLLHIKPSKFDRARIIPIGDGLGRVLAEIIRYVKRFYNSESVPVCDHWYLQEKRPRPPAPYLIQGIRHPSTAGIETIRSRIREISIDAGARRSDGTPLVLLPHEFVAIEVLEALRPLGVQAALDALDHTENQTDDKRRSLELALQKARYEASRIERQYQATEPENRLVAAELEKRWNNALTHVTEMERRLEEARVLAPQPTTEQRQQLLALGDDLEQLWDHPRSPLTLKKRILRTVLQEVVANTTDDPPSVHLKLHWAGGSHTELTVPKNRTGYHNHINSQEVTELIRELALVCEDASIVSILNRLGYRTGNSNTWTEKRVQHVRHTNGFPACPPPDQRLWITMQQAAAALRVSEMVIRRLIAQRILPAKQIVKFAPWMIERTHLELPAVRKQIRRVHEGRHPGWAVNEKQEWLFTDSHEVQP
jgi:hypothetical protein